MTDSPAGLAAYLLEKFSTWTNDRWRDRLDGGLTEKFTYTDLLDNVMIYWATNSITTSMRIYAETFNRREYSLGHQLTRLVQSVSFWCLVFSNNLRLLSEVDKKICKLLRDNSYINKNFVGLNANKFLLVCFLVAKIK